MGVQRLAVDALEVRFEDGIVEDAVVEVRHDGLDGLLTADGRVDRLGIGHHVERLGSNGRRLRKNMFGRVRSTRSTPNTFGRTRTPAPTDPRV